MVHANSIHVPHSPISYWSAWYHMLWCIFLFFFCFMNLSIKVSMWFIYLD